MELMRMDCPECHGHNTLILKANDENLYDTVWECEKCDFIPIIEVKMTVCVGADGLKEIYDKLEPIFNEAWKKILGAGLALNSIHMGPEGTYFCEEAFPKIDSDKLVEEKLKEGKRNE